MNVVDAVRIYMEIGILGLCGVMVVILFVELVKRLIQRQKIQDKNTQEDKDNLEKRIDTLIDTVKQQNDFYLQQQAKNLEDEKQKTADLIDTIIKGVVTHVPSKTENDKLTEVNKQVDEILKDILIQTNASRCGLVQYHNGGKGVNRQAFLKMSMTNEKFDIKCKSLMCQFKEQFRSVLGYFVNEINENGHCYINNVESMSAIDIGVYDFMKNRNIEAEYGYAVHDEDEYIIGFILLEFEDASLADEKKIDDCFKEHYKLLEKQLLIKIGG